MPSGAVIGFAPAPALLENFSVLDLLLWVQQRHDPIRALVPDRLEFWLDGLPYGNKALVGLIEDAFNLIPLVLIQTEIQAKLVEQPCSVLAGRTLRGSTVPRRVRMHGGTTQQCASNAYRC